MKSKIGVLILAGAFLLAIALPLGAEEGKFGKMTGTTIQTQGGDSLKMEGSKTYGVAPSVDPSLKKTGKMNKKGRAQGPEDGTENIAAPTKDEAGNNSSPKKRVVLH